MHNLRPRMAKEHKCKQAREEKGELEEWPRFITHQTAHGEDHTTESETNENEEEVIERVLPRRSERERRPVVQFCCE